MCVCPLLKLTSTKNINFCNKIRTKAKVFQKNADIYTKDNISHYYKTKIKGYQQKKGENMSFSELRLGIPLTHRTLRTFQNQEDFPRR